MAINIKNQIFTLHTKNSTYQMKVDEQNMLIHTYYGNRTDDTDGRPWIQRKYPGD